MKLKKIIGLHDLDETGITLDDLIRLLQELKEEYRSYGALIVDVEGIVSSYRDETDHEYKRRLEIHEGHLERERKRLLTQEKQDRELYLKLKEKYGPDN